MLPARHVILDEGALAARVLPHYGLPGPLRCRFYRRGMSDVYRVECPAGRYFFKVYLRDVAQVDAEAAAAFALALREREVAVAAPLADETGRHVRALPTPEGVRYAVLYPAVIGPAPVETDLAQSRAFGRLAAELHRAADDLPPAMAPRQLDERHFVHEPLAAFAPYLADRPADLAYLAALGGELVERLGRCVSRTVPQYGLCHGDLHTGNARYAADGRLTLFDLDSFGCGWRGVDIGVYHVSYDWQGLSPEVFSAKARFWGAFLDGYTAMRPLAAGELAAAQLCLPLRHLELMNLTLRHWAPYLGDSWADDAYWDEQVAWFREWERVCGGA